MCVCDLPQTVFSCRGSGGVDLRPFKVFAHLCDLHTFMYIWRTALEHARVHAAAPPFSRDYF